MATSKSRFDHRCSDRSMESFTKLHANGRLRLLYVVALFGSCYYRRPRQRRGTAALWCRILSKPHGTTSTSFSAHAKRRAQEESKREDDSRRKRLDEYTTQGSVTSRWRGFGGGRQEISRQLLAETNMTCFTPVEICERGAGRIMPLLW